MKCLDFKGCLIYIRPTIVFQAFTDGQNMEMKRISVINESLMKAFCSTYAKHL